MGPMRGPGGPGARGMRGPRPKIKNPGKLFMRVMKYVFKDYAIPYIIVIACIFIGVFASIQGTLFTKTLIDEYIKPFLLTDTVGFIRKLPTDLVESFKSTLDEVREADMLVHVVDISHPDFEEQIGIVEKTIADLGAIGKPTMIVFNKIDAYTYIKKAEDDLTPLKKENISLEELMKTWMAKLNDNCIFISAREKTNLDELKTVIYNKVRELHVQKYPYNDFLYHTYEETDM